jgi:hypothetical protein
MKAGARMNHPALPEATAASPNSRDTQRERLARQLGHLLAEVWLSNLRKSRPDPAVGCASETAGPIEPPIATE